ncbi:hypothetical protein [Nocardia violaceofusca]|uniref:hypothetical protein n=1 Tax=Nocardia violaceofusca TaxID=941182 RepID=UPI0007A4F140|nr:hypothetical protein [Nocardia violaceofusca]
MIAVSVLIDDIDAAIDRVRRASTPEEQRRAVKNALDELYSLRTYREAAHDDKLKKAYHRRSGATHAGQIAEGLSLVRGAKAHDALKDVDPRPRMLYPSANLFPGENTYPGRQLIWRDAVEMGGLGLGKDKRRPYYDSVVAGQPALETLVQARNFLATDPGPCSP